jgi:carbamoyl-phosphate synthase small subunit
VGELNVVLIDCGVKANIIKSLWKRCNVIQVPYDTSQEEIMALKPHGVLVSNGPGDPSHPEIRNTTVKTLKEIVNEVPTMGICLGHQLLSLVFGAETFKLKFGHRGGNQPVKDLESGRVYITSQNHGFAVRDYRLDENSNDELIITQVNVNDGTVEGMRHSGLPVLSVQYHPEASPGPRDSRHLFDEFIDKIKGG